MRPPMQSAALQQNESIIHHHHHQQQQQLPLHQIQLHAKSTALTSASDLNRQQQIRKTKFQQREILVENQLNFACSATAAAAVDASPTLPQSNLQTNLVTLHPQTYQQQQSQRLLPNRHNSLANSSIDDEEYDTIQLVDLSTTPPSAEHTFAKFTRRTDFTKRDSAQRSSIISDCQYSRSSSSEDGSLSSERYQSCSRSNIFDDAAENFIINFPGDSATHNQNDNIVNLPLSETEPLLTNIESTLLDKNRAICLRKNSGSLIYTKKEQLKTPITITKYNPPPAPNTIKNNNSTLQTGTVQGTSVLNSQQKHLQEQRRHHFSFHSTSESNRKQTKHLPATYYQQRRSLQLNYNNNLVTTSTCSANNNFSCSSGLETGKISSVLHKNRSNALPAPSIPNTTASTSRKQHAYSWYAPVYSALEEELEQDSRDSSPVHNLANIRKHHYQHRSANTSTSPPDNETVALLETRNQINIQAQLHTESSHDKEKLPRKPISTIQVPDSLPLQNTLNVRTNSLSGSGDFSSVVASNNYDIEGPHAGSLGLAGGPLPPRKRIKNFFKSLVGLKSSNGRNGGSATNSFGVDTTNAAVTVQRPVSPEIRITRTPSEQNLVVIRSPTGRQVETYKSSEKLVNGATQGSTSSLNVVQQKIRNILRREDSVNSLNHEKSQSVVQYKGLRKCETMVALTRQTSLCSPVLGENQTDVAGTHRTSSGIFNANGVEQIRPLNRLRNSATSINMTCSRCSSLLSLAASTSRYSLNVASTSGVSFVNPTSNCVPSIQKSINHHPQELQELYRGNIKSCRNIDSNYSNSHDSIVENVPNNIGTESISNKLSNSFICSRKSSTGVNSTHSSTSLSPPSNLTTATLNSSIPPSATITPTTLTPTAPTDPQINIQLHSSKSLELVKSSNNQSLHSQVNHVSKAPVLNGVDSVDGSMMIASMPSKSSTEEIQQRLNESIPFQSFTCKLCLVDVENIDESTTLVQCGCRFCTECMKAYIEYEISEGAYEISCPDAQCPEQGIITLPEIANLTTANLMKKHHRYRLNREIELDKTRTWCPRAGCETVCLVGPSPQNDAAPSTSTSQIAATTPDTDGVTPHLCAVQCPTCNDIFCSSCKKTWHPSITCEEHSRRLVADGQDDIGIPFDNDLIKCCPMCAVPIEKDEGCAQMMCKRCKHVFCWYCLASLDDDFLLRHYDKGPCKNKLGHSRASVVWHRAQVIGIFAGFGILLLVASPLLLLAAPCIICCKCRSCSGSKTDEGDGEIEEGAVLQS